MDIYGAASLFAAIILVYWIISEVFTVLFRLIGLPEEKARFQVTSLLTACGFTTGESEMFLSTRARRRLVRATMMFGFVFNITILSALINVFVSLKLSRIIASVTGILILIAAVVIVVVLSRVHAVRDFLDRIIEKLAAKLSGDSGKNTVLFVDEVGSGCIAKVTLRNVPPELLEKTLAESRLRAAHNLMVLLVEHKNGTPEPPTAETVFLPGDRLTVFGPLKEIREAFEARELFTDPE